jgi:hypothetical protein
MRSIFAIDDTTELTGMGEFETVDGATFITFLGRTPPPVLVAYGAMLWRVLRCGAELHIGLNVQTITEENSARLFCLFHGLDVTDNGTTILYKRVRDDFTDYFSGSLRYEVGRSVTAPDWVANPRIVAGNALHLAPSLELSRQWNEGGRLLKCRVALSDMCVCPYNPTQVRCRRVDVLEEVHRAVTP